MHTNQTKAHATHLWNSSYFQGLQLQTNSIKFLLQFNWIVFKWINWNYLSKTQMKLYSHLNTLDLTLWHKHLHVTNSAITDTQLQILEFQVGHSNRPTYKPHHIDQIIFVSHLAKSATLAWPKISSYIAWACQSAQTNRRYSYHVKLCLVPCAFQLASGFTRSSILNYLVISHILLKSVATTINSKKCKKASIPLVLKDNNNTIASKACPQDFAGKLSGSNYFIWQK